MATQYSNKPIVTDGLVYALDFGNPKSYVSGSTTANSLLYNPVPATFSTVPAGDYQGLAAAYSVRKVVSSYTGSAMMVQSASVSQSIGFDANGNLDTASLASFAGSGDAFVKIWYDQSGNGRDATQTTLANQPQIVSGGSVITLNGKPSIENSSGKQLAIASSNIFAINFTTFVINPTNANNNATLFRQTYQNSTLIRSWTGGGRFRHNNGAEITYTDTNTLLIQTQTVTPAIQIFKNGILKASAGTNGVQTPLNVESYLLNSGFNEFFGGKCSEAIFYTSDQSSNRTSIENDINSYYSIYSPLPSSPIPGLTSGLANFESPDALLTNQTFNGFSYDQGNSTIMYVGETKGTSSLFTQDTNLSVVATTSSVGFGSTSNNLGRTYPVTGLKHVTLRFSSGSVDCFVNGIPVPANSVFPTGSSVAGGKFAIPVYTGSLGLVQVYNRPLTGDEIWNNYQLTAPRYGLGPLENKPYTLDDNAYLFLSQSGITDPIITGSIDTFVRGLKSNNLWDKMIAIYPFVGTGSDGVNLTGSHKWNLKEPSLVTYPLSFTGSWNGSTSGSAPSGSNTNITVGGITPSQYYPFFNTQSAHISILSYDTPVSSSYLMGTGMTEDLAISTLAGDYGTPAAAYSVRKVRTAYSGALMDVRRSFDNVTQSIGFVDSGDLDTGSLINFVNAIGENSPGEFEGLAAAYSLRRVSASYSGDAIDVRRSYDNTTGSIGFDSNGNLSTSSLFNFVSRGDNAIQYSEEFDNEYWGKYGVAVTPNTITAPDGTLTADTVTYVGLDNELYKNITTNGLHTFSMFVSGTIGETIWIGKNSSGNIPQTGSLWTLSGGWQRISASFDQPTGFVELSTVNGATARTVYAWGAQLNSGSVALPYVKTVASTKTNESGSFDTVSTGFVAQWYDQSGNNRHATQTATGSQPLIVSSGSLVTENGKPALDFNGTSNYFNLPNIDVTTPFSSFAVGRRSSNGTEILFYGGSGVTHGLSTDNKYYLQKSTGYLQSNNTDTTNQQILLSGIATATTQSQFKNSSEITSTFISSTISTTVNKLGYYTGASPFYFNGKYQELSLYLTDQSSNRPLIENNINNYYNIYTGSNHGFVARWYDQSGNNNHATQTTTARQPQIVTSGSVETQTSLGTVKPAIRFNNVSSQFLSTSTINNVRSVFATLRRRIALTDYIFWLGAPPATDDYHPGNGLNPTWLSTPYTLNPAVRDGSNRVNGVLRNLTSTSQVDALVNLTLINSASLTSRVEGIGRGNGQAIDTRHWDGHWSELTIYTSDQTVNREPIEYGINNYYNIYPQTSSFATSSFTIYTTTSSISASINNDIQSGIASTGPLGFITVSRTGSNSLTIAKNGVTSSFSVPASGALSTGIYLGAINNNGLALGNSPLNLSFASVGTGLTGAEVTAYDSLVNGLQFNLGRPDPNATAFFIAAGITDPTQRLAVSNLAWELKIYGLWNKMKAIYPMVGQAGVSSSFEVNLKDPNTFRGTFSGSWLYSDTGVTGNGEDTYMDTGIDISTISKDSIHASVYNGKTNLWEPDFLFGVYTSGTNALAASNYPNLIGGQNGLVGFISDLEPDYTVDNVNSGGLYLINRQSSIIKQHWIRNVKTQYSRSSTAPVPGLTLLLGANINNLNNIYGINSQENRLFTVGDGLTDTDAANFYAAVQRFQTTLGRQV